MTSDASPRGRAPGDSSAPHCVDTGARHKALPSSHDTKRQRGSTCEKRKTTEPRVLRDDARKHRVHRRRGARGGARKSGSSGARRRGRLRRRVLRVSSREIAAKSKTHLHDIASSDAGRAQGFPRVAREEVGELSLLLLLATRGLVALARLEVRARAQRGDPPQLRGQPGVELGSGRKAGGRVSVALRDAEDRCARGEHRHHRGSVTKRKRDERWVARACRTTARGRIAERRRLEHHAHRPSRPALLLSGAVRCPRRAASDARSHGDRLFACGRKRRPSVSVGLVSSRNRAFFFRDSCVIPLSNYSARDCVFHRVD